MMMITLMIMLIIITLSMTTILITHITSKTEAEITSQGCYSAMKFTTDIYMCICMYTCTCVYIYIYICIMQVYVYIYIYIYIYQGGPPVGFPSGIIH